MCLGRNDHKTLERGLPLEVAKSLLMKYISRSNLINIVMKMRLGVMRKKMKRLKRVTTEDSIL